MGRRDVHNHNFKYIKIKELIVNVKKTKIFVFDSLDSIMLMYGFEGLEGI